MGGDGGSIPGRRDLVIEKSRGEKIARDYLDHIKWRLCSLSQEPLRAPIVACELGRLYNKESIIGYLLAKSKTHNDRRHVEDLDHIRSLKDVKELNITRNPDYVKSIEKGGGSSSDVNLAEFICHISGLEMNGKSRFMVIWTCGCVLAERAIKELKTSICSKCGKPYTDEDLIYLNGNDDEMKAYRNSMLERRAKAKSVKKAKKRLEKKGGNSCEYPTTSSTASDHGSKSESLKRPHNSSVSKETITSKGRSSATITSISIQSDPKASKVLKSLFTSSDEGKNQKRAHWVTYNPFYN